MKVALAVALALAPAACCSDAAPISGVSPTNDGGRARLARERRPDVTVLVDGKPIAGLDRSQLARPTELSALIDVPPADWKVVEGFVTEHRRLALRKPIEAYPTQKVMLFLGEEGEPCFGTFLREDRTPPEQRHLLGTPRVFVRGIVEVRVRTEEDEVKDVQVTVLEVAAGDRVTRLEADQIRALPAASTPDGASHKYWTLSAILGLAGMPRTESLVVIAADGSELEIPKRSLRDRRQLIALKINRRGLYKLSWWDTSKKPPAMVNQARDVRRIEVR